MMPSEESIKEYKEIYKKEFGEDISDNEARTQATRLLNFFRVLYEVDKKDKIRKAKLKDHPKGFHLEDGVYNCIVCHRYISGENSWYDKSGPKCLDCQRAIDKKVIPRYVCKDRDSWYSMLDLKNKFGVHPATAEKMMREGKLEAKAIKDKEGKDYFYIFIKKENNKGLCKINL